MTLAEPGWKSILELNVAQGTSIIEARI